MQFRGLMISIDHGKGSFLPNSRPEDWPLFADLGFIEGSTSPEGGNIHVFMGPSEFSDKAFICTKEVDGKRFTMLYFGFHSVHEVKMVAAGIYRWDEVVEILERPEFEVISELRSTGRVSKLEEVVTLS